MLNTKLPPFIAHRGAQQSAPENTLPAFKLAHEQGFQWVEFDVLLSKDRVPVTIHDETVDRTTNGHGYVQDLTYAELQKLSINDHGFCTHIPSLQETLDCLKAFGLYANIELKTTAKTTIPVLALLQSYDLSRVLISSFSMPALYCARKHLPSVAIGLLLWIQDWALEWPKKSAQIMATYRKLKAFSIHINQEVITPETLATLKTITDHVLVYTVNDAYRAKELLQWGVDSIFTDTPLLRA